MSSCTAIAPARDDARRRVRIAARAARGNGIMDQPRHPHGPPMDLANMREQGVRTLIAYCLNHVCRHTAVIDVSTYPGDTLVTWFRSKVQCKKCGARHNR